MKKRGYQQIQNAALKASFPTMMNPGFPAELVHLAWKTNHFHWHNKRNITFPPSEKKSSGSISHCKSHLLFRPSSTNQIDDKMHQDLTGWPHQLNHFLRKILEIQPLFFIYGFIFLPKLSREAVRSGNFIFYQWIWRKTIKNKPINKWREYKVKHKIKLNKL